MSEPTPKPSPRKPDRNRGRLMTQIMISGVLPMIVLAVAIYMLWQMMSAEPQSQRQGGGPQPRLVETIPAERRSGPVTIEAMGTVMSAREVQLRPRVGGQVEWISPALVPGGRFEAGEPIVRLEPEDYELAVQQQRSELEVARSAVTDAERELTLAQRDLKIEQGNQMVAEQEFELLSPDISPTLQDNSRALVLRQPQLEAARADVEASQAGIESAKASLEAAKTQLRQAELDLDRTTVRAPFNAIVEAKSVAVGDTVSSSDALVRLLGAETFWIELAVPEPDLKWIEAPVGNEGAGSNVRIYNPTAWGAGVFRDGRVLRRLPSVNPQGRMARLLVAVNDPLAMANENLGEPRLLVGSYVQAEITGESVNDAITIPRRLIRNGDQVWVMTPGDELAIRSVDALYRGREEVIIASGLEAGERVVSTDISMPVSGMPLRVESDVPTAAESTQPTEPEASTAEGETESSQGASAERNRS